MSIMLAGDCVDPERLELKFDIFWSHRRCWNSSSTSSCLTEVSDVM